MSQPRSSTATLIKALAIIAKEDRSEDGIAGAALLEASQRLQEMQVAIECVVADCGHLHHEKKHAHRHGQMCPVEQLILKARGDYR